MIRISNLLFLTVFLSVLLLPAQGSAETKRSWWGWTKKHDFYRQSQKYRPLLEDSRHVQIPQWEHEDWYAEDWLSQKDGMELISGFYDADILRDQVIREEGVPVLVVGPNFYRLSGFDKRRVVHVVDVVYGITESGADAAFELEDWNTRMVIGAFDKEGLRLR